MFPKYCLHLPFEKIFLPQVPVLKIAERQVVFRSVEGRVSCQALAWLNAVLYIEFASRQRAIPQVLLVTSAVAESLSACASVCPRPASTLVDIVEDVVSFRINCVDLFEYFQQTLESFVFSCIIWYGSTRHEHKQAVEAVVIGLRSIDTFIHKQFQERMVFQDREPQAEFQPVASAVAKLKFLLEVYVRTAFCEIFVQW